MNFIMTIPNARTESEKQKDGDFITFDLKQQHQNIYTIQ